MLGLHQAVKHLHINSFNLIILLLVYYSKFIHALHLLIIFLMLV